MLRGEVESTIKMYQSYYDKVLAELKKVKKKVPDGVKLYASKHGKTYQYYIRLNGTEGEKREYISKEKMEIVKVNIKM